MKTTPDLLLRLMAALAATALAGCAAAPGGQPDAAPHAGESTAATGIPPSGPFYGQGATGGSAAGSATQSGDKGGMCAMHRNMEGASTEEARRATEERHLAGMSPEQRRQHMEMMRRQCK